jgi:ubiquinone/menaquinone biosynthesis C-methylase UbiE
MVNFSNVLAWVTGNARDTVAMKHRMRTGYEGISTDDVTRYDELGFGHYTKISEALLAGTTLQGKIVLDVGCGTGILSILALKYGAAKVVCGDLSEYMLSQCEKNANAYGYTPARITFRQLDAETLPFGENVFDQVISGMVLGLIPNQQNAIAEMVRVLNPGGTLSISTHAPELYFEACETAFRALPKSLVLGYRVEYWPRREKDIFRMFSRAGLTDIFIQRLNWTEWFDDGGRAYDFFVSTSSAWWYSKFPPEKIPSIARNVRNAFERKNIKEITTDIILAHGRKS